MLIVWGRNSSYNVQKVRWLMGELALPYQHISVGGAFGGLDHADFIAMNPHARIPVLSDNGTIIWESHAILRYLAATYAQETFWFDDVKVRGKIDPWMDWAQTSFQPDFLTGVFWGFYRTPDAQKNWPQIHQSLVCCNKHFHILEQQLKDHDFLCTDQLSLADITVGTGLYRYFELDIERPHLPRVNAWYQRLQERPAYREHVMIPFHEMKGRLEY